MTTAQEIGRWFDQGIERGATHMIVMCDTFDWEDYPVYTSSADEARKKAASPGEMQKVMEVYNLALDREQQLGQTRAWNFQLSL